MNNYLHIINKLYNRPSLTSVAAVQHFILTVHSRSIEVLQVIFFGNSSSPPSSNPAALHPPTSCELAAKLTLIPTPPSSSATPPSSYPAIRLTLPVVTQQLSYLSQQ